MNDAEIDRLRAENADLRARLDVMQASKFWRLRNVWFSVKERIRGLRLRRRSTVKLQTAFTGRGSASKRFEIRNAIASMKWLPTVSILVTLDDSAAVSALPSLLASLDAQAYMYWELCIAFDIALHEEVKQVATLGDLPAERLRMVSRGKWQDSARGANSALALATGEFILLMLRGRILTEDALYEIASLLNEHSEADVVIDPSSDGRAFRRSLALEVNGFAPGTGTRIDTKLVEALQQRGFASTRPPHRSSGIRFVLAELGQYSLAAVVTFPGPKDTKDSLRYA